jgi:hypothetical protein
VAHNAVLTALFIGAAVWGVWGAVLAIRAVWITVEFSLVNNKDCTAVDVRGSFEHEHLRLREYWRQRAKLPTVAAHGHRRATSRRGRRVGRLRGQRRVAVVAPLAGCEFA